MSSEWKDVELGDLIAVKHGFAFKGEHFSEEQTSYQLVTPGNFSIGGGFQLGKGKFYSGPIPDDYVLQSGDLVVTMTDLSKAADTLGFAALVPETKGTTWLHNQRVGLVRCKPNASVDLLFLHYVMRSSAYRHWVVSSASGSTVKHTSPGRICSYRFLMPPLSEQQSIARTLSALDDRITLLRETNATLEAIAHALFKSWFVDVDPVRAKMEGRAPEGMDEATAALFPGGFEESALGLVPEGWRLGTLADLAQQHKGSVNPLRHPNTLFEHFSLPAFDNGQLPVTEWGSEIKSNKTTVPADAVLLSKLNPHIPRVWLPVRPTEHAVCSTEFLVFVPVAGGASREFVYCTFSSENIQERLRQLVTGTSNSHQRVKPVSVSKMQTLLPTATVLEAFAQVAKPLFKQIGLNRLHAQTLATLRDTLLPRLISGQLRLPENMDALAAEVCASGF